MKDSMAKRKSTRGSMSGALKNAGKAAHVPEPAAKTFGPPPATSSKATVARAGHKPTMRKPAK